MGTYRLFGSTSGPAAPVAYSGPFIAGVVFAPNGGGAWFSGYWWWVCPSGQSTSPVKCALWSAASATAGQVVPGSVVTSGPLTAGQWNFIPVSQPLQLAPSYDPALSTNGSTYIAAVGVNGNFPDTGGFWGSTGANGIWGNGVPGSPLIAYSGTTGTVKPPNGLAQGVFSSTGTDPSATMPVQVSGTDNFWVDIQLSDTAPPGYSGSYRLWPNKIDGNSLTVADAAVAYNVATEIDLSGPVTLDAIHYIVPPDCSAAAGLATSADIWDIGAQVKVATISAPSWTTETGGAPPALGANAAFWARAAFPGGLMLGPGLYRVSVYNSNGALGAWSPKDAQTGYFTTGVGSAGISWGPLTAPNKAGAQAGDFFPGSGTGQTTAQPVFAFDGLDSFPHFTTGANPAQIYWVDLEVTPESQAASTPAQLALMYGMII